MRCSICGAQLKKEGDICNKCYKEFKEEEQVKNDKEVLFKLKRKYLPRYQLTQYTDFYIVFFLAIVSLLAFENMAGALILIPVLFISIVILLYLNKLTSRGTQYTFFKTNVKYKYDFLFIHREKVIKNSEVTEIKYYQTRRQKWFGLGDIRIYTKGMVFNWLELKNIADVLGTVEKLKKLLNIEESQN